MANTDPPDGTAQFYEEVWNVIRRYGKESDVSVYQVVATLERIKFDIFRKLDDQQEKQDL